MRRIVPVSYFDFEALKFYGAIVALSAPVWLLAIYIVRQIRLTNASWYRRGFEVKLTTGEPLVPLEREQEHD